MRRRNADCPRLLVAALLACAVHAEHGDRLQAMHVDANSGEVDEKQGLRRLIGDVRVNQGTLSFTADVANIYQHPDGSKNMISEGRPVRFKQKLDGTSDWVNGHANRVEYDSKSGELRLIGDAWFEKGGDTMSGNLVTYNTVTEKYTGDGGKASAGAAKADGGRVHIEYQPERQAPAKGAGKPGSPAAQPPRKD
jgi:lipopolysaccharide export system protein LptA